MYRVPKGSQLSDNLICHYIALDIERAARREKNRSYYDGKHSIIGRTFQDASKPNNRLVCGYPKYISDCHTGYFMGTPVQYSSEDESLLEEIQRIADYNDDAAENSMLAAAQSIEGSCCEIIYLDADKELRYRKLEGDFIAIYDDTLEQELMYVIRYYSQFEVEKNRFIWYIDVYSESDIRHYKSENPHAAIQLTGIELHQFGMVPIAIYRNNEKEQGDFEQVISLIDAYDSVMSDSVNDRDYFSDAYLLLTNAEMDPEQVAEMKTNRVICLPENSSASFLVKQENDAADENLKNRLTAEIHKQSFTPDMSDENFGGNASGIAMRYKLMGTENIASIKERMFKLGLQRRFEIICRMLSIIGEARSYMDINIQFTRTIPVDESAVVSSVMAMGSLVSDETKLSMLPYDIDPQAEMEKRRKESVENYSLYFAQQPQMGSTATIEQEDDVNG